MDRKAVRQILDRNAALRWLATIARDHPLGVVPRPTAARILGVSPRRLRSLIEDGRIREVGPIPGGHPDRDVFVPVEDLIDAPLRLVRGRVGIFGEPRKDFSAKRKPITRK